MDHLKELQGRLFSTVLVFILVAAAAYPFFGVVTEFLMAPLKEGQELVYLTPGGAFSFILKVCAYIGLVGTLPVIIYHIYKFIMPVVRKVLLRTVLLYTTASFVLAVVGSAFAYYISLPAALYFLTGFNLNHINPMLTIDSYFSFIMTYMLAGALLFQLPLIMMIINSVTPLTPSKLMKAQGKVIVGSFIVAAVISPTPDALNQTLLASPLVVMYQVGIFLVWRINAKKRKKAKKHPVRTHEEAVVAEVVRETPAPRPAPVLAVAIEPEVRQQVAPIVRRSARTMDMVNRSLPTPAPRPVVTPQRIAPTMQLERPVPTLANTVRTIDGVIRIQRTA